MVSLDKLVLSVFVFFVFIIGGVLYIHDIESNYAFANVSMGVDTYLNGTFYLATDKYINTTEEITASNKSYSFASGGQDRLFGEETTEGTSEDQQYRGSFSVFRLIMSPIGIINNIIHEAAVNLGIPQVFVSFAFISLTVIFLFSVIYLIFRVKA